jgi:hypothetical protein
MPKCLNVKYPLFLSGYNETWIFSMDCRRKFKYQVSSKSVQWEPSCSMRTDGHYEANSRFSQFANTPNNGKVAPVNDKKTYRWSGGTDALILNLGNKWRWVVNSTHRRTYPREGTRCSLNRRFGGPQSRSGSFWKRKKLLCHTGIRAPNRRARNVVTTPTTLLRVLRNWNSVLKTPTALSEPFPMW